LLVDFSGNLFTEVNVISTRLNWDWLKEGVDVMVDSRRPTVSARIGCQL
jgi:hypothetical protein